MTDVILRVALPVPTYQLYDYLPPTGCSQSDLRVGARVRVPFGRQRHIGILVEVASGSAFDPKRLRAAGSVIDDTPVIDGELLDLARWASRYYQHPLGEVLDTMLPERLRKGEPVIAEPEPVWRLTATGRDLDLATLTRAPRQARVLRLLLEGDGRTLDELRPYCPRPGEVLRSLQAKGWVSASQAPRPRSPAPRTTTPGPALTAEQRQVVDSLTPGMSAFGVTLLEGITGSGKTEIYLQLMLAALQDNRQVLVLVPEISLTPQLVERLEARLGCPVALLHSGLNPTQRLQSWRVARSGEAPVILGTRSAVFVPLARPGLFIVDEEHDPSLKQQEGFRYSARDLVILRARQLDRPVLLGSATPSLESLRNVETGRFSHLVLNQRPGRARSPSVRVLDVRSEAMQEGLSRSLLESMQRHLDAGGQVMLFVNRRGFAPVMQCHECGWTAQCGRCDIRLVLHKRSAALRCHHCGHSERPPEACPACGGRLFTAGHGTERVEAFLESRFSSHNLVRIDRDTTRRKGSLEGLLGQAHRGEATLLLGTQMLAKGHDFPGLTLVAVINADQGLFGVDFRASERLAQLIVQVAGRAGRADRPGEVLIQTHYPDHPLFETLLKSGYGAFARTALQERREAGFPPYSAMAIVRADALDAQAPMVFLGAAKILANQTELPDVDIWEPMPAPVERLRGRYRAQLMVTAPDRAKLQRLLDRWVPALANADGVRRVRWSVDVDPMETG